MDRSLLHPREIFHPAIELNAFSVILVHNHPSGNPQPSPEDNQIVKRMVNAGDLMGILFWQRNIVFTKPIKIWEKLNYVADGQQISLRI